MMDTLKRKHYIIGGILLLLAITNPSDKDLKSFGYNHAIRKFNGLIFSIYSRGENHDKKMYLALLGNVICLGYA